jgi:hypothetical protein
MSDRDARDDLNPTALELDVRIIRWLGGRRYVADHIELARARDRAHDAERGGVHSLTVPGAAVTQAAATESARA